MLDVHAATLKAPELEMEADPTAFHKKLLPENRSPPCSQLHSWSVLSVPGTYTDKNRPRNFDVQKNCCIIQRY